MIYSYDSERGTIEYEIFSSPVSGNEEIRIVSYKGKDRILVIPEKIEDRTVSLVRKKAFFGAGFLEEIILPAGVKELGEWAFASCRRLRIVTLCGYGVRLGTGCFKNCDSLEYVYLQLDSDGMCDATISEEDKMKLSGLFAGAVNYLDYQGLLDGMDGDIPDFVSKWDSRMELLLKTSDDENYADTLLCGEEDYAGQDNDYDYYCAGKRMSKVRICICRLLNDILLDDNKRKHLLSYLKRHRAGEAKPETWTVILSEHGDEKLYYDFMIDEGLVDDKNLQTVLDDMGDKHTEMKALLLRRLQWSSKKEKAFDLLSLDF